MLAFLGMWDPLRTLRGNPRVCLCSASLTLSLSVRPRSHTRRVSTLLYGHHVATPTHTLKMAPRDGRGDTVPYNPTSAGQGHSYTSAELTVHVWAACGGV
eukprot:5756561-Prymnesium_polylepis.1